MTNSPNHLPVMLNEAVEFLAPRPGAIFVDATFGGGGYSAALLRAAACQVIGIDRDPDALRRAAALIESAGPRLTLVRGRFGAMVALLRAIGIERVDGVAFDLGVSSHQIEDPARGFSFRLDGPLDMRMDPDGRPTAAEVVNGCDERRLAEILWDLGEERAARRIAAAIVKARTTAPIDRTLRLADVVRGALPRARDGIDPATRTFQALRMFVNDELGELDRGLNAAERLLAPGGRLVAVAFHSLEDRRVKTFLRSRCGVASRPSRHRPEPEGSVRQPSFRLLTRRALRPSPAETAANPRARSARLRAAERTDAKAWTSSLAERMAA